MLHIILIGHLKCIASIDINSVSVQGKLLRKLLADVDYDGSARILEIKNISSEFYGGKFIGAFILADSNEAGCRL